MSVGQNAKHRANAMTVDVEDYFQVHAFDKHISRDDWHSLPSRIAQGVDATLQLFEEQNVHATFFTLGWIAKRHPTTVQAIVAAGHEIASHGWDHKRVDQQTPEAFREDCKKTKILLEDLSGQEVSGYRAASFSIGETTPWAHPILQEVGYRYSSSIYPIRHDDYGMPGAPRFAYHPCETGGVIELPVSTFRVAGQALPCGGGGYFRLLPKALTRWALNRVNQHEQQPCIFYFHSWEMDKDQPKQHQASALARFRHYHNLHRQRERLIPLLQSFRWVPVRDAFKDVIKPTESSNETKSHNGAGVQ